MKPDTLSARDAASAIARLEDVDDALRRRASGLTWMIWGIVAPATFVNYALVGALGHAGEAWTRALWAPWALAGIATTIVLWRTSGLPRASPGLRAKVALHIGLFVLGTVGLVAAARAAGIETPPTTVVAFGLSIVTLLSAITGLLAVDAFERVVRAVGGVVLFAGAMLAATSPYAPAVAAGVAFFGGGLLLALRA